VQRSLAKRVWYEFLHFACRLVAVVIFRARVEGRRYVPKSGPVLVLSNHQSNFDPVLIGLACDRRLNYLARDTLFGFAPFRWLIRSLDAIPIDREGVGLAGLKETLRRLKRGEMVLMFPEGTRTRDGRLGPLKPGFCAVARRARTLLMPAAIDGAFDAWPRDRLLPRYSMLRIQFGPAVTPEEIAVMTDDQIIAEVYNRLSKCLAAARDSLVHARRKAAGSGPQPLPPSRP
jgi:1-acyl-sn-glycerol-3-phosphate acyltransferase